MSGNPFKPLASALQSSYRPIPQSQSNAPASSSARPEESGGAQPARRRKGHRGGKKKRSRRKSFAVLPEDSHDEAADNNVGRDGFYQHGGNFSNTSIDSEALLDHRDHQPLRARRTSTLGMTNPFQSQPQSGSRLHVVQGGHDSGEEGVRRSWDEGAPLLSNSGQLRSAATAPAFSGYGAGDGRPRVSRRGSSKSSRALLQPGFPSDGYNINYPPSVPGSPMLRTTDRLDLSFGDVMIRDELELGGSPLGSRHDNESTHSASRNEREAPPELMRRNTMNLRAEEDVCFPTGMSELGEEDLRMMQDAVMRRRPRRRRNRWPDLSILEEWSRIEKEGRSDERRVKRITEPQLINGRLRPIHKGWFRTEEDAPYRFTYFNEEFPSTIHSQTISELIQVGGSFEELFIPEPRVLSDDESEDDDDDDPTPMTANLHHIPGLNGESKVPTRRPSVTTTQPTQPTQPSQESKRDGALSPSQGKSSGRSSRTPSVQGASAGVKPPPGVQAADAPTEPILKAPKTGDRPVWWLDVLCPTEAEMKILSKAFGIHPLTAEDIMVEEAREKVELFRHYYFVNYRTFDQDMNSENYLEPVNMYVIVFREGVLSFHFSMTPHPANVRRRIRQLKDYLIVNSDWISYAIIDDITDVFGPLIQNIEDEVDDIDDAILKLHSSSDSRIKENAPYNEKGSEDGTVAESGGDMLRRVGDCRKRVMSLYRLLGNKADVIKGFAKRCNERWEVAPRSDIGLYLGDIQDHIVTMTSNLSHYEKILARSHGNYLAQINIRMNERQEQTADVLGKLTVLGTIVLPMNIITGLWGMNVWVPGQEHEGDLRWFWVITAGLVMFGMGCYLLARRVYKIV